MSLATYDEATRKREIAKLTTRTGRVLMIAYADADGTYSYRGEGCGGFSLTRADIARRFDDAREWPGGKTAKLEYLDGLFRPA
jgi:hypothetical protein